MNKPIFNHHRQIVRLANLNNRKELAAKDGFTLIEAILYIGIFSVMIFAITSFLGIFTDARIRNQVIAEVEQQGAYIAHQIAQSIRDSDAITFPGPANSSDTLILDFPGVFTIDLNAGVIEIDNGTIYQLNSSRVNASNLIFDNLSRADTPGVIRVSFTLSHVNPSGMNQYNYSQNFYITANIRPN